MPFPARSFPRREAAAAQTPAPSLTSPGAGQGRDAWPSREPYLARSARCTLRVRMYDDTGGRGARGPARAGGWALSRDFKNG